MTSGTDPRLAAPVFFVGMPRSGTTILFERFLSHQEYGWLSNYSARYPSMPTLNGLLRLTENRFWFVRGKKKQHNRVSLFNRLLPKPQEAYPFWQHYCGDSFLYDFEPVPPPGERWKHELGTVLAATVRHQGKTRFCAKLTGPPRIRYLDAIFGDAVFVHIVRDGRAVVNSLMNVGFWREQGGYSAPFWRGAVSDTELDDWRRAGGSPELLAALQWRNVVQATREQGQRLDGERYLEVHYEAFIADPESTVRRIGAFCARNGQQGAYQPTQSGDTIRFMSHPRTALPTEVLTSIEGHIGQALQDFGYENLQEGA